MSFISEETIGKKKVKDFLEEMKTLVKEKKSGRLTGNSVTEKSLDNLFETIMDLIGNNLAFDWVIWKKVGYLSVDPTTKEETKLSTLLIIPLNMNGKKFPIMGYQHGTELERKNAPSCFNILKPLKYMEVVIATAMAAFGGYITAMPDYQGMGDDETHSQPYVVAEPLAKASADLLKAVKNEYEANWNNELFLSGYSEGGYVTMVTAREIQTNSDYAKEFTVTAAAAMAGPYSLTGAMKPIMIGDQPYEWGYFLPMTIRGYHAAYPDQEMFSKEKAFKPEYQNLYDLVDGYHTVEEVTAAMPSVPSEALTDQMIEAIKSGKVHEILQENNAYDWKPAMPMYLYHCPDDITVPPENSVIASKYFRDEGLCVPYIPMFHLPLGSAVHVEAALPCFLCAYTWFDTFLKKE